MCPKSTEYVAKTRKHVSKKHEICVQKARNVCLKSTEYVAKGFVAEFRAAVALRQASDHQSGWSVATVEIM